MQDRNLHSGKPASGRFLTPEQIAQQTQLCTATIRRACADGELKATKLRGHWRIPEGAYLAWVKAGEPEPGVVRPQPKPKMASPASRWQLRAIEGGRQ